MSEFMNLQYYGKVGDTDHNHVPTSIQQPIFISCLLKLQQNDSCLSRHLIVLSTGLYFIF